MYTFSGCGCRHLDLVSPAHSPQATVRYTLYLSGLRSALPATTDSADRRLLRGLTVAEVHLTHAPRSVISQHATPRRVLQDVARKVDDVGDGSATITAKVQGPFEGHDMTASEERIYTHMVFFAGGIGATAVMPMIKRAALRRAGKAPGTRRPPPPPPGVRCAIPCLRTMHTYHAYVTCICTMHMYHAAHHMTPGALLPPRSHATLHATRLLLHTRNVETVTG